jgi:AraC-like DNA-binding protein
MPLPSQRTLLAVGRWFRRAYGLRPAVMDLDGRVRDAPDPLDGYSRIRRERIYALHESVNLGAPYLFTVAPGVLGWLVALEDRRIVHGALLGGPVRCAEDPATVEEGERHLRELGAGSAGAAEFLRRAPVWPRARASEAAQMLQRTFYEVSGWKPLLMSENRLRVQQQQQIAAAIEDQKRRGEEAAYPFEKERVLLSHIRAGDPAGARKVLNEMLGAMYMSSPRLVVLRARAIELMGYLTRAAVEDSPAMEPLIERNHRWMERLIRARDFEDLARTLTAALEDFIEGVYVHGFNRTNAHVSRALDLITREFSRRLTLAEIARHVGLSPCRIAHLVKEHTGKTLIQIVTHARVQRAQHLLEHTSKPCTEIAYEVGFNDQSYFIKHFRRLAGITPARYRRTRLVPPRQTAVAAGAPRPLSPLRAAE